jgi:hypothetical protein
MDDMEFKTLVLGLLERIMGDLTNLNAAVAANTQAVTDVTTAVNNLKAEVAAGAAADQAGIDAATAQIQTNNTALEALKSS